MPFKRGGKEGDTHTLVPIYTPHRVPLGKGGTVSAANERGIDIKSGERTLRQVVAIAPTCRLPLKRAPRYVVQFNIYPTLADS